MTDGGRLREQTEQTPPAAGSASEDYPSWWRALRDIRARMGERLSRTRTDGEAAVILGEVQIIERRLRRLEAASDLVSATCRYCDAQPGDHYLDSGQLYFELEHARENYRLALRAMDRADDEEAPR